MAEEEKKQDSGDSGSGGSGSGDKDKDTSSGDKDKDNSGNNKKEDSAAKQNIFGQKLKAAAEKYIGKTYSMAAGTGPDTYDCSGFVQAALKDVGVEISRTADLQYLDVRDRMGKIYDADDKVPICGDLIFYENTYSDTTAENCGITHVGIMLGDGEVIECNKSTGVAKHKPLVLGNYVHHFGRLDVSGINLDASAKTLTSTAKARRSDSGTRIEEMGEYVTITKLPENKNYAEPIYPDYVTVSDTCPAWVLAEVDNADKVTDNKAQGKDGDASETAPNGRHYFEYDIKALMDKNPGMTREQAISELSKQKEYTEKWTNPDKGNQAEAPKSDEAPEIAPNGQHYKESHVQYLLANNYSREAAIELLSQDEKYKKKEENNKQDTEQKKEESTEQKKEEEKK